MAEKQTVLSEMELQPEEVRRVRVALVDYVERALTKGSDIGSGVDVEIFPAALNALTRLMELGYQSF